MSVAAPRISQNQIERKVSQLRGSGHPDTHLALACSEVLRQQLPLRDAIVLREARRYEAMATQESRDFWKDALARLAAAVPDSTYKLWLEPLSPIGVNGIKLLLAAPSSTGSWVQRRYSSLIREALAATDAGFTDVEIVSSLEETPACR